MNRYLIEKMQDWLSSSTRKPMVLRGARQVGKTWLVRELARQTGKNLIELNFEKQGNLATHFDSNDPATILLNLQSALNKSINPENSLLFLDEIQASPHLLAKLRWFYETIPELPVIAAGSLLEFTLKQHAFSMPVGRIQYYFVEPLGFEEFLHAKNASHLAQAIKQARFESPLNQALHQKASELFGEYLLVGGMPEAVNSWVETHSLDELAQIHSNLINTYKDDFAKYSGKIPAEYLQDVLNAIPKMITNKLTYKHINPIAKHSAIKQAVNLLSSARICHKVQAVSANGIPLTAEIKPKMLKMLLLDIGLASSLLGLKLFQVRDINEIMLINKGAIAEQVVGQLLRLVEPHYIEPALYYWSRENKTSTAEIDYLIQHNQQLIPIEVKAGSAGKLRSLHQFMSEKPWKTAVRFYSGKMHKTTINTKIANGNAIRYELLSLPLYMVNEVYRLLDT